jgi:hypothetical protein
MDRLRNRTISFLGDELSAGSFGCGNNLVEARITAQIIPARIETQIAICWASGDRGDSFELLERDVPCTHAPRFLGSS